MGESAKDPGAASWVLERPGCHSTSSASCHFRKCTDHCGQFCSSSYACLVQERLKERTLSGLGREGPTICVGHEEEQTCAGVQVSTLRSFKTTQQPQNYFVRRSKLFSCF